MWQLLNGPDALESLCGHLVESLDCSYLSQPSHGHNLLCTSSHLVNDLWKTDTHIASLGLHCRWQNGRKVWEWRRLESFMVFIQMLADCARATASPGCPFTLRQTNRPPPQLPGASTSSVDALFRYCSDRACWHIP